MPPPSSGAEGSFPFKLLSSLRTRVGIGREAVLLFERMKPERGRLNLRANGAGEKLSYCSSEWNRSEAALVFERGRIEEGMISEHETRRRGNTAGLRGGSDKTD